MRLRTWLAGVAVVALVGTLAFAAGSLKKEPNATTTDDHVAWYVDTTTPTGDQHMATPAKLDAKTDSGQGADYANNLSKAFRDAAEQVLPSLMMIINTPAVEQVSNDQGRSPDKWWGENPFGDMFPGLPGQDLHRFFKELPSVPQMPRHGMQGMGSGVIVDALVYWSRRMRKTDAPIYVGWFGLGY